MRSYPSLCAVLLALLLIGGCSGLEENRRNADFGLQALSFENAMRWGNYKLAATYIRPGTLTTPIDFDLYEGVQITDYKVRNTVRDPDDTRITLEVRIAFLRKGEASVRTVDQTQPWEYDATVKRWWLMTSLPDFR